MGRKKNAFSVSSALDELEVRCAKDKVEAVVDALIESEEDFSAFISHLKQETSEKRKGRMAWVLVYYVRHPKSDHHAELSRLISESYLTGSNDAMTTRSWAQCLLKLPLTEDYISPIFDKAILFAQSTKSIAVRAFSLRLATRIADMYPALLGELELNIAHIRSDSPGIRVALRDARELCKVKLS